MLTDWSSERFNFYSLNQMKNHQFLGQKYDLFHFSEHSPGVVYWHPDGWKLFSRLVSLWQSKLRQYDWQEISSPVLAGQELWQKSGHLAKFKDNMFFVSDKMGLKPMSCPGHADVFAAKDRSYQDLPMRYAELGYVHRNEPSGALNGLLRVRGFHQDDGHVFCAQEDVGDEVRKCLAMALELYEVFGLECRAELSGRPENALGKESKWNQAESELEAILAESQIEWKHSPGEGAFYGPKIDLMVKDHMNREWQVGSIQLDYVLPENFDLVYRGKDNQLHRPVMIHRASYGSVERFVAILLEHWQHKIPVEFAPNPLIVLPVSEAQNDYANALAKQADALVSSDGPLGKRIAMAIDRGIPKIWVVGKREAENQSVSVQVHGQQQGIISAEQALLAFKAKR